MISYNNIMLHKFLFYEKKKKEKYILTFSYSQSI